MFNLMADEQRIDEVSQITFSAYAFPFSMPHDTVLYASIQENKVRLQEEYRRQRLTEKKREKVKQEIVMRALGETSDLDALRRYTWTYMCRFCRPVADV